MWKILDANLKRCKMRYIILKIWDGGGMPRAKALSNPSLMALPGLRLPPSPGGKGRWSQPWLLPMETAGASSIPPSRLQNRKQEQTAACWDEPLLSAELNCLQVSRKGRHWPGWTKGTDLQALVERGPRPGRESMQMRVDRAHHPWPTAPLPLRGGCVSTIAWFVSQIAQAFLKGRLKPSLRSGLRD